MGDVEFYKGSDQKLRYKIKKGNMMLKSGLVTNLKLDNHSRYEHLRSAAGIELKYDRNGKLGFIICKNKKIIKSDIWLVSQADNEYYKLQKEYKQK